MTLYQLVRGPNSVCISRFYYPTRKLRSVMVWFYHMHTHMHTHTLHMHCTCTHTRTHAHTFTGGFWTCFRAAWAFSQAVPVGPLSCTTLWPSGRTTWQLSLKTACPTMLNPMRSRQSFSALWEISPSWPLTCFVWYYNRKGCGITMLSFYHIIHSSIHTLHLVMISLSIIR